MVTYEYKDSEGKDTSSIKYIVSQDVTFIAYQYIEKNGKAPSKELISDWTNKCLTAMGWYDD